MVPLTITLEPLPYKHFISTHPFTLRTRMPEDPANNKRSSEAAVRRRFEAHWHDTPLCAVSTFSANGALLSQLGGMLSNLDSHVENLLNAAVPPHVVVACETQHADALAIALPKPNVIYGRGAATSVTGHRIRRGTDAGKATRGFDLVLHPASIFITSLSLAETATTTASDFKLPTRSLRQINRVRALSECQLFFSWHQRFAVIREGARMRPCPVLSNNSRGLGPTRDGYNKRRTVHADYAKLCSNHKHNQAITHVLQVQRAIPLGCNANFKIHVSSILSKCETKG
jgi:hypothetical protein